MRSPSPKSKYVPEKSGKKGIGNSRTREICISYYSEELTRSLSQISSTINKHIYNLLLIVLLNEKKK